ncbi:M48 family metalloprotease [Prosthecobacter sp.]|uniref:M48 family metalloprotease n=1 Tax=Prosthecobacter sp. TaxID=1965333 RepID=UPI00378307C7
MQGTAGADMTRLVREAFSGSFARGHVSIAYRLGVVLVLLALLILPLLYLAVIAGMGWLLAWHVQHDVVWMSSASEWGGYRSGRMVLLAGFLYLAVAVAGVICILFMMKPLFAPLPKQPPTVTLDPISQPALFALIYRICDLVGAPRPVMVEVDSRVNASASFRRGMASFFSHDLVLSIGMPLVAGMTARQFAGVLAHEFGHFAQGGSMRLNYLVRSINRWFARVVLERDGWDERLEALGNAEGYSGMLGNVARIMVNLGRRVMLLLMHLGGAISGFMSRHREYDADAYGAKVAGSREMENALLQLGLLDHAETAMVKTMLSRLKDGELPDNVPGRIASQVQAMPEAQRKQVKSKELAEETSWWSTHPALKDRKEKLEELAAPGVCTLDLPAEELFHDFTGLCKTVSLYWYDVELGLDLNQFNLVAEEVPNRHLAENRKRTEREAEERESTARQAEEQARRERLGEAAVREMFGHPPSAERLMPVPMVAAEAWEPAAAMVKAWKGEYGAACEREKQQRDRLCRGTLACRLTQGGQDVTGLVPAGVDARNGAAVMAAQAESLREYEAISKQMAVFEQAAWTRIGAALAGRFQQEETAPEWRGQVSVLVEAQRALAAAMAQITAVCVESLWLEHARGATAEARRGCEARVQAGAGLALRTLGAVANPYEPERRPLAAALGVPAGNAAEFYSRLITCLCHYANRVTCDLCVLAYEVECGREVTAGKAGARESRGDGVAAWQPAALPMAA